MNQKFGYTTVDTIFAKFSRDLRGNEVNEADMVEWIGEALSFMKVAEIQEEAVAFIEVADYKAELPCGFQSVIQVARNNNWVKNENESCVCPSNVLINSITTQEVIVDNTLPPEPLDQPIVDCEGNIIGEYEMAYYRPYFDLKYEYYGWNSSRYFKENYTPIRLANHSFFNTMVATEQDEAIKEIYNSNTTDEYTLAGGFPNYALRFSFKEGSIALSYLRTVIDAETGYPVIPDNILFISAITYYVKWKISERFRWEGREGSAQESRDAEEHWLKYVRQAINHIKMPHGVDQYQNIMENSLYLIPRTRKYYGFFGNLGREEDRRFNNPDNRRRYTFNRYGRIY